MRLFDWSSFLRNSRRAARRNIRVRQRTYRQWSSPIAAFESLEQRQVLAAPTAIDGGGSTHMNFSLTASVNVYDPDIVWCGSGQWEVVRASTGVDSPAVGIPGGRVRH